MGYKTVFLLAETEIARGKVIATLRTTSFCTTSAPPGLQDVRAGFRLTTDSKTGIVGVNTRPDYDTFVTVITAIMGMTLFAEYIDGIAVETITRPNRSNLQGVTLHDRPRAVRLHAQFADRADDPIAGPIR